MPRLGVSHSMIFATNEFEFFISIGPAEPAKRGPFVEPILQLLRPIYFRAFAAADGARARFLHAQSAAQVAKNRERFRFESFVEERVVIAMNGDVDPLALRHL